jgi:hypothetical protein
MLNNIAGLLSGGAPPVVGDYNSISTVSVGSGGQTTISFTSIPSTYTHLQVRGLVLGAAGQGIFPRLNGSNTNGDYKWHYLEGNGSSASAGAAGATSNILQSIFQTNGTVATYPNVFVMDILDYKNTNKLKTARTLFGADNNSTGGAVGLDSGVYLVNTNAITQIDFTLQAGNFAQYSTIALYGEEPTTWREQLNLPLQLRMFNT